VPTRSGTDLTTLIADTLDISPVDVTDDTGPGTDARWTSLKHVELVVAIEERFGVALSYQEILDLRNVAAVRETLRQRGVLS
jgi:acyl carrier protein